MNIALIGHGRTGREVERLASERNISVKKIFIAKNNVNGKGLTAQALKGIDVCVDFTTPAAVIANIKAAAGCGKNIVVGTTGWYDRLDEVKNIVKTTKIGLLYAPNFSLGMNIFSQVLTSALQSMDKIDEYDVAIHEIHHRDKTDSPSGTALMLGNIVLDHLRAKKKILSESAHRAVQKAELHVTSTRVGHIAGIHKILFDSTADTIELVHTAKDQSGFALGVLIAAEWLQGKKGIFTMKDVMLSL